MRTFKYSSFQNFDRKVISTLQEVLMSQSTGAPRRVAIVTGGSRGIGKRIAERLAAEDYAVVIGYRSAAGDADAAVANIARDGGTAIAVAVDVADDAAVAGLFDAADCAFGGVDVVVHAAAMMITHPLADFPVADIDAILRTNLLGAFLVNRQAMTRVREGGAIVNLSSAVTRGTAPGYSVYTASKAGLEAMVRTLSLELRGRDVTINAVAPGPTETEMLRTEFAKADGDALRQFIVGSTPLGRIGQPDDVADVVLAFAGPLRWIHGQVIHVSGGMV
jgi:3-oxoacyl-[acyl-carrier protein] reductase